VSTSSADSLSAIDSGTTLIGGPSADVQAFWQGVQGSSPVEGMQGFFSFPCNTQLEVTISFGGTAWPINSADMNLGQVPGASDQCMGGIFDVSTGADIGNGNGPDWIVGDTFLKNVYSVFRQSPPSVGFAQLSSAAGSSGGSPSPPGGTPGNGGSSNGGARTTSPLPLISILLSIVLGVIGTYLRL